VSPFHLWFRVFVKTQFQWLSPFPVDSELIAPLLFDMAEHTPSLQRVLLFDGDCGFCQQWCDWARRRGAEPSVSFRPCVEERRLREQASISDADCGHAAYLVEVRGDTVVNTHRAAAALSVVLRQLPGPRNVLWRIVGRLYRVPGLKQIEDWAYGVVARNRHRLGTTSCRRSP
jgi:predicted DCC family thiol-disulfide oxidoreductase YuxK